MKKCFVWCVLALALVSSAIAHAGGPVVLMGIDAEDGGIGGHGPITVYQSVATSILNQVTKPGASGILVIGGDNFFVQPWWQALGAGVGQTVTFVSGANIATQNFSSYKMIGIASDYLNTFGGLTNADNDLLTARAGDIAAHINSGGGLLGFSSCALTTPYGYLGGAVTCVRRCPRVR